MFSRIVILVLIFLVPQVCTGAWIYSFDGPDRAYQILRNGEPVQIDVFVTLEPDDEIKVLSKGFGLVLGFSNGSKQTVTSENSPYIVPGAGEVPTRIYNFIYWAKNVFKQLGSREELIDVNMITRNERVVPPSLLITQQAQYLRQGRTRLSLLAEGTRQIAKEIAGPVTVQQSEVGLVVNMIMNKKATMPLEISLGGDTVTFSVAEVVPDCPHLDTTLPSLDEACSVWLFMYDQGKWQVEAVSSLMALEQSSLKDYLIRALWHRAKRLKVAKTDH